ncbi:MAG TPA: protease inhibitor I42 family protein [Solimonas sp.]|nr:protease inhibitor I42 family protein [Solimonas sp.]
MRLVTCASLLAVLTSGCAMMGASGPVALDASDNGKTIELSPGQALNLSLVSNHTTGYRWIWASPVNPVLAKVGEPTYTASASARDGVVGAGGTETWTFQATKEGETTLRMEYRRPWSMQVPAQEVLSYKIKVD